ncbi:ribosome maturation factor RimM [soil metagenome]
MQSDQIPDLNDCIFAGRIVKSIGLKGSVKVIPFADDHERFSKLKRVFLYSEKFNRFFKNSLDNSFEFYPEEISYANNFIRLKFKGYDDIDSILQFKDTYIAIPEVERVKLPPGEFFLYEVIGFDVYDKDMCIGKVKNFSDYGSGDLFVIESKENSKEFLIPARKEFIVKVDKENKQIILDLIEGFTDL